MDSSFRLDANKFVMAHRIYRVVTDYFQTVLYYFLLILGLSLNPSSCCISYMSTVYITRYGVSRIQASFYGTYATRADPDQTPHHAVSDQDLHCLLT